MPIELGGGKYLLLLAWRSTLMVTAVLHLTRSLPAADAPTNGAPEALENKIRAILEETGTPGMIGAIVHGETVVWQGALGTAERETQRPVTEKTLFRLGSVSKMFVSLAMLKLVERGQLSLDDPLPKWAPEIGIDNPWDGLHPVQLVHLLEHTSGLPDLGPRGHALDLPSATTQCAVDLVCLSRRVRWQPGTRMAYSNLGPALAALALENASSRSFEELVKREVFEPLGMAGATYLQTDETAASYIGRVRAPYRHILKPSGGASATSQDMAQLLKMFNLRGRLTEQPNPTGNENRPNAASSDQGVEKIFLKQASLTRMETPTSTLAAEAGLRAGFGLGNRTRQKKGFVYQGHGGGIEGFISIIGYLPDAQRGYFFAINASHDKAFDEIDDALTDFLTKDLPAPSPAASVKLSEKELRSFEGTYLPDSPGSALGAGMQRFGFRTVAFERGQLVVDESPLQPAGHDRFTVGDNPLPTLAFVESPEGDFLLQSEDRTWVRVHPLIAYGRPIALVGSVAFSATTLLFAPVWMVRKLLGQLRSVRYLSVRILPLLATMSLFAAVVLIRKAPGPEALAQPSFWSVGFCLASVLFALLAGLSLVHTLLHAAKRCEVGLFAWSHSLLASIALATIALLLANAGVIGLCTWTY